MSKRYDDNQLKAINAYNGYFLVLAPPGCGKTDILAERIMNARERGVAFDDMLCLTFTNRASRGMKNRVLERLGEDANNIFVGNIHRFCSKHLFSEAIVLENTSIIDEEDQADLFLAYDNNFFSSRSNRGVNKNAVKYVGDLSSYIQQRQLGHPANVLFEEEDFPRFYQIAEQCGFEAERIPAVRAALRYALEYLKYKKERNIIDFTDILILAYEHMRCNEHKTYRWIQVDEVQDLNPLQMAIVDLLTGDNPTVMYLGDEQQAIFSFMGAKLSLLTMLKNRCVGNILTLDNNYRAPQYLLDICNDYAIAELGVDPSLLPTSVNKSEKKKFDVILTESENVEAEKDRILNMAKYYLGLDDEERLAILVTKNDEADAISQKLTAEGISNFKISGIDMFKTRAYKTISSFYSVLVNDFNFVGWSRLLYGIGAIQTLVKARGFMTKLKSLMMTPSDLLSSESYLQRFKRVYDNSEFVFFDTETTGLNVLEDDIVQIAAFKVKNGDKVPGSDFNILLETNKEIPPMLSDKTNPLIEEYAKNPHLERATGLQMFIDYIGDCPLLGHNVTYDYLILKNNVEKSLGEIVEYDIFDSLHIIKCVEPNLRMYKLEFLLQELQLAGKNSHLANEDIDATKSLVDYCYRKMLPMLPLQEDFGRKAKVRNVILRMQILSPLFDNVRSYLYLPISATHRTIADELNHMHQMMVTENLINDLGSKYTTFLRFVESEWLDYSKTESLYDQICTHVYDITSTINEGDLVNSEELLQDRVFIMTVYKGKGLEFENVVVLGAVDGTYPYFTVNKVLKDPNADPKKKKKAQIERMEDARKFYVAISRAKKRLCVSYTKFGLYNYFAGITPFMHSIKNHFYYFRKPT